MKTIVKDCRTYNWKAQKWVLVDVEVELDPAAIGRAYAGQTNDNKSGRSKQLGGLVTITRLRTRLAEDQS